MKHEPVGYRTLARRLARDLAACVAANDFVSRQHGPKITAADFDRCFRRAHRTVLRFLAYEQTHRGRR